MYKCCNEIVGVAETPLVCRWKNLIIQLCLVCVWTWLYN